MPLHKFPPKLWDALKLKQGIYSRLPRHYLKSLEYKEPTPVHWRPLGVHHRVNKDTGLKERVQDVPVPIYYPPESQDGLWGGEGWISGYRYANNDKVSHCLVKLRQECSLYLKPNNLKWLEWYIWYTGIYFLNMLKGKMSCIILWWSSGSLDFVDVQPSAEDLEATVVQEGVVQRDPGPQVRHHGLGPGTGPHRCCLRIWFLHSQSKKEPPSLWPNGPLHSAAISLHLTLIFPDTKRRLELQVRYGPKESHVTSPVPQEHRALPRWPCQEGEGLQQI